MNRYAFFLIAATVPACGGGVLIAERDATAGEDPAPCSADSDCLVLSGACRTVRCDTTGVNGIPESHVPGCYSLQEPYGTPCDGGVCKGGCSPTCVDVTDCPPAPECHVNSCAGGFCYDTGVNTGNACDGGICKSGVCK